MDITKKEDFVFVTEDALKNISVSGIPYPVRNEQNKNVLPILGDDFAYLREALLERQYIVGSPGDELNEGKPSYGTRIRIVHDSCDEEHDSVKTLLENNSWIDKDKMSEIGNIVVAQISGPEASYAEKEKANEDLQNVENKYKTDTNEVEQTKADADEAANDKYDSAKSRETQRWSNGNAVRELESKLREDLKTEAERHEAKVKSEDDLHTSNISAINKRYNSVPDDKDIDFKKWDDEILQEEERHIKEVYSEQNLNESKCSALKIKCEIDSEELRKQHDDNVDEYEKEYADELDKNSAVYEDAMEKLRLEYYESIYGIIIGRKLDWKLNSYVCVQGKMETLHERSVKFMDATLKVSCAHKWYERTHLYERAATPINRTFADLERMDVLNIGGGGAKYPGYTCWEIYPYFVCGAYKMTYYNSDEPSYFDEGVLDSFSLTSGWPLTANGWTIEADECYFMYGRRSEVDIIEKIEADVWQYRYEKDNEATKAREDALASAYKSIVSGPMDERYMNKWKDTGSGVNCNIEIISGSLSEDEDKDAADRFCQSVTDAYNERAAQIIDSIRDRYNLEFSIQRVEFTRKDEPAKYYTDKMDAIADKYAEDLKDLTEAFDESISSIEKTYNETVLRLKKEQDERNDRSLKKRDDAVVAAHEAFIESMIPLMETTNTSIIEFEKNPDNAGKYPSSIWSSFISSELSYKNIEETAVKNAEKSYADELAESMETYEKGERASYNTMILSKEPVEKKYKDDKRKLEEDARDEIDDVYDERQDAWREINKQYNDAYNAATRAFDDAMSNAEQSAASVMDEGGVSRTKWKFLEGYGIGWVDDYEPTDDEKKVKASANSIISKAYNSAYPKRQSAIIDAVATRWSSRKNCPVIRPNNRVRFSAKISAIGSDLYSNQFYAYTDLLQVANITVYYKPKSRTGMDVSGYKQELEDEAEEAERRKQELVKGGSTSDGEE